MPPSLPPSDVPLDEPLDELPDEEPPDEELLEELEDELLVVPLDEPLLDVAPLDDAPPSVSLLMTVPGEFEEHAKAVRMDPMAREPKRRGLFMAVPTSIARAVRRTKQNEPREAPDCARVTPVSNGGNNSTTRHGSPVDLGGREKASGAQCALAAASPGRKSPYLRTDRSFRVRYLQ